MCEESTILSDTTTLLIGGAIGFVSAIVAPLVLEPLRHRIFGPKLTLQFNDDRACKADTKENVEIKNPNVPEGVTYAQTDAFYIRLLAENSGRQIAKQCRAYLINVERFNAETNKFEQTIYSDSIRLAWSARGTREEAYQPLDLPPNVKQYVDVVSTRKIDRNYKIEIHPGLLRYQELFEEHGKFRFTIQVSGDNVKPVTSKLIFEWAGDWENFSARSS